MTTLPAIEIVETISHWIDIVEAGLTSERGRQALQQAAYKGLYEGTLSTEQVIAAAEAGHQAADLALRAYAAEFIDQGREAELSAQVRGYAVKSLLRPIVTYPQGRNLADTWLRDIGIAVMADLAATRWSLSATRNPATTRPSAAYFVSIALKKKGFDRLKEQRVNRIYWDHDKMAAKLSASMPPI